MPSASDTSTGSRAAAQPAPLPIRVIDRLTDVVAVFGTAGVILLVLNIVIDVVGRLAFHAPFPGTVERTTYWWMPTIALLAFAFTEKRQEHIKVAILLDALPLRMRQIVEGVFGLLATALIIALAHYSWEDAVRSYDFGEVTASSPPVVVWPFRFVAVIAMAMLALQSAANAYRYFAGQLPKAHEYDTEAEIG